MSPPASCEGSGLPQVLQRQVQRQGRTAGCACTFAPYALRRGVATAALRDASGAPAGSCACRGLAAAVYALRAASKPPKPTGLVGDAAKMLAKPCQSLGVRGVDAAVLVPFRAVALGSDDVAAGATT